MEYKYVISIPEEVILKVNKRDFELTMVLNPNQLYYWTDDPNVWNPELVKYDERLPKYNLIDSNTKNSYYYGIDLNNLDKIKSRFNKFIKDGLNDIHAFYYDNSDVLGKDKISVIGFDNNDNLIEDSWKVDFEFI